MLIYFFYDIWNLSYNFSSFPHYIILVLFYISFPLESPCLSFFLPLLTSPSLLRYHYLITPGRREKILIVRIIKFKNFIHISQGAISFHGSCWERAATLRVSIENCGFALIRSESTYDPSES